MPPEPRVAIIEGQRVLVMERRPPLPQNLASLLALMTITFRAPIRITGWRPECSAQDHRLALWIDGRYLGPDGVRRELRLMQCADCEGVQVRDITLDRLPRLRAGGRGPARRDHILGWYSGARRGQRQYR